MLLYGLHLLPIGQHVTLDLCATPRSVDPLNCSIWNRSGDEKIIASENQRLWKSVARVSTLYSRVSFSGSIFGFLPFPTPNATYLYIIITNVTYIYILKHRFNIIRRGRNWHSNWYRNNQSRFTWNNSLLNRRSSMVYATKKLTYLPFIFICFT